MTNALAYRLPKAAHQAPVAPEAPGRHIEIVSTRAQRLGRPRLAYSLVVIGGLFAVLVSQLLLSIGLAEGAYEISALQSQQKELSRDRQAVTERLNLLNSPQNLAARAESLGMVTNSSAVFLNLADGSVLGAPAPAKPGAGSVVGANGSLLIPNSLLGEVAVTAPGTDVVVPGAPVNGLAPESVASLPGLLPAPVTR